MSRFSLTVGVRQGGVLSPLLFAISIVTIIDRVKTINVGWYISTSNSIIFLYADGILLLAPTTSRLQALLKTCKNYVNDVDMCINVKKSMCIRFGRRYKTHCPEVSTISGGVIKWVDCCRNLGVYFSTVVVLSSVILIMQSHAFSEHLMLYVAKLVV